MPDNLPTGYSRPEQVQAARDRAERLRQAFTTIKSLTEAAWADLVVAYTTKDYVTLGWVSWQGYCEGELHLSRQQTYRVIGHAQVVREIAAAAGVDETVARGQITQRTASVLKPQLEAVTQSVREQTKNKHQAERERVVAEVVERAARPSPPPKPVQLVLPGFEDTVDWLRGRWAAIEAMAAATGRNPSEWLRRVVEANLGEAMTPKAGEEPAQQHQGPAKPSATGPANRLGVRSGASPSEKCLHPPNRRLGVTCAVCGATVRD